MGRLILLILMLSSVANAQVQLDKLNATLGWFSNDNGTSNSQYMKWACDGILSEKTELLTYSLTVDSDLSVGDVDFDILRTWWRVVPTKSKQWKPIFVLNTEGDHSVERLSTTISVGVRRVIPNGFIELTVGANKDIRTADNWQSDIGLLVDYQKRFGNFGINIRPNGLYGNGEAHLRNGRMIYILDTTLGYHFDKHFSLNYILNYNNTMGYNVSNTFIGLGYTK
jgi:hypothetical protein